ncbi:MAG: hypothetical protein E6H44_12740 [Betaproteobacteria bacterium]|nr:MAG: hypothetical protein E6H44_12740 [Betaproteobacteria bacterium]
MAQRPAAAARRQERRLAQRQGREGPRLQGLQPIIRDRPRFSQSHGGNPLPDQGRRSFDRLLYRARRLQARSPGRTGLGLSFRNEIESGPGGKQIQLEDPDGNPIELFQPA